MAVVAVTVVVVVVAVTVGVVVVVVVAVIVVVVVVAHSACMHSLHACAARRLHQTLCCIALPRRRCTHACLVCCAALVLC